MTVRLRVAGYLVGPRLALPLTAVHSALSSSVITSSRSELWVCRQIQVETGPSYSLQPDDKQQITASIDPILIVQQRDDEICREVHTNFNQKVHSNNMRMTTAAIKFLSKYLLRGFPLGGTVASVFIDIVIDELTKDEEVGKEGTFYVPWGKSQCPIDGVAGQEYKVTAIIPVTISGMAPYEASIDAEYHLSQFYVDAISEMHYETLKRNNER